MHCRRGVTVFQTKKAEASVAGMRDACHQGGLLTVTGVRFVSFLLRCSCCLLFLLAVLITAALHKHI